MPGDTVYSGNFVEFSFQKINDHCDGNKDLEIKVVPDHGVCQDQAVAKFLEEYLSPSTK